VAEVLTLLYLHGLSTADFLPALQQLLGIGAGLSAGTASSWNDPTNHEVTLTPPDTPIHRS
jgi:putative transposase